MGGGDIFLNAILCRDDDVAGLRTRSNFIRVQPILASPSSLIIYEFKFEFGKN